jgi:hypothetical protein
MTHVIPGTPSRARDLLFGFIAGALAVVAFHQVMVCVLRSVGMIQSQVYAMRGVPPYSVPTLLNQMFWGGLWGLLFAGIADTLPRWPLLLLGCGFGVLGPVLASWFVVAPLKGTPLAAGWVPLRMLAGLLINGFWGDRLGIDLRRAAPLGLRTASGEGGVGSRPLWRKAGFLGPFGGKTDTITPRRFPRRCALAIGHAPAVVCHDCHTCNDAV